MDEMLYWYWFSQAPGISRMMKHKMLDYFASPEQIYYAEEEKIKQFCVQERCRQHFLESRKENDILHSFRELAEKGIQFVHMKSECYPKRLTVIPDSPIGLFLKGSLPREKEKAVAIIGTRECTRYGSEMARVFSRELGKAGIQIISGLAKGIDGMAHLGALEGKAYTLGVLGCGIDVIYPKENFELFMRMERSGGILSESGPGVKPYAGLFPQRNRLIAGLADGILVVEAMEKSGTFITVDQGLEQGKEILALPGRNIDARSRGCNNLIKMGAHIVTEVSDVFEILHFKNANTITMAELTDPERFVHKNLLAPNEKMVYSCLRVEPQYLDDIIRKVQIAPQEVCMALNHLVIIGGVVETTRNYYALKL